MARRRPAGTGRGAAGAGAGAGGVHITRRCPRQPQDHKYCGLFSHVRVGTPMGPTPRPRPHHRHPCPFALCPLPSVPCARPKGSSCSGSLLLLHFLRCNPGCTNNAQANEACHRHVCKCVPQSDNPPLFTSDFQLCAIFISLLLFPPFCLPHTNEKLCIRQVQTIIMAKRG